MNFSSKYIENAVNQFAKFPGIGKKTALRLVIHLLGQTKQETEKLNQAIKEMKEHLTLCQQCNNYADESICSICKDKSRKHKTICVVESMKEVMAIENTGQYNGLYHVLGGVISPVNGVGPGDLSIQKLLDRLTTEQTEELIMALNPTIEGDTTVYYISKKVQPLNIKVSTISRGVAFGGELEYTDEITLGRSIASRLPYHIENHR